MVNNSLPADYQHVYQLNLQLLTLCREENWEAFTRTAEIYIIDLHTLLEQQSPTLSTAERQQVKNMLSALLVNENEMVTRLSARLDTLKENMSSLARGTRCNKAYSDIFSGATSWH